GTEQGLDTLGDRMMTPVVYQNRNGAESLWADHTIIVTLPNGPTLIRWYQFDVTGGNFPLEPVQQQDWSNGNDALWRWMPSIAVDENGNTAIGYSTSSTTIFPSIRYAGRLATDPLGNLSQGEAIMTNGGGSQTRGSRWGGLYHDDHRSLRWHELLAYQRVLHDNQRSQLVHACRQIPVPCRRPTAYSD